ncbi:MAG TPA: hypothetical protein VE693_03760 [Gaiellaceae bacterium]|nr:hypothetical protein [Gaiellaceae bacterium]
MPRTFGLVSVTATLVVVAFLWTRSAHDATSPSALGTENDAAKVTASFNLQQATGAMELWKSANGTYTGALLPPANGVTVVRADATSYCLQAGVAPNVQHLDGPGGNAPVDGPC